jgi:hypothetical protein
MKDRPANSIAAFARLLRGSGQATRGMAKTCCAAMSIIAIALMVGTRDWHEKPPILPRIGVSPSLAAGTARDALASRSRSAHKSHIADEPTDEAAIVADLEDCSPFFSFTGAKQLDFDAGTVVQTEDPSSPRDDLLTAPVLGAFVVDEATRRVQLTFRKSTRDYTLIVPTDSDQCILAVGQPNAADLQQSWYGEFVDDPDASSPKVVHASLR